MGRSEAEKRAQAKYEESGAVKAKTKGFYLKCHTVHDADIIAALKAQKNQNGYIKELIRADIEKRG